MKTSGNHLIDTNVYGTQDQVKKYSIFHKLYKDFYDIDFKNTFFSLNLCETIPEKILNHNFKKIIISYHSEHIHYQPLYDIFNENKNRQFLLISDFSSFEIKDDEAKPNFWPDNVTEINWLSWGEQLSEAIKISGIADKPRIPSIKVSSLSNRHEYHKAAITAFLLKQFSRNDMIISWHKWKATEKIFYLEEKYAVNEKIAQYLFDDNFLNIDQILIDNFNNTINSPRQNVNWMHPAFVDCAVNITNESTFQTLGSLGDGTPVVIPGPYITDKTIKPLLGGTAFLHVGQPFLFTKLNELGISTDFGFPADYDDEPFEDERILKIYDSINFIMNSSIDELYQNSYDAIVNNLQCIRNGTFYKNCEKHNSKYINKIYEWSLINP